MNSMSTTNSHLVSSPNASLMQDKSSPSDTSDASRFFSKSHDTTGMTSFDSFESASEKDPNNRGSDAPAVPSSASHKGENNATPFFDPLTDATNASFASSHSNHPWKSVPGEQKHEMSQSSNTIPVTIVDLPTPILQNIFTLTATNSYSARLTLPLVCKTFHAAVSACAEMWGTFEVLTGNHGALTSKSQVEYVAAKAGSGPLSIGMTIASCRLGAWESGEPLPPWSTMGLDEDARSAQALVMQGLNLVGTILSLMPRVRDFILDVQDDPLEPALARAVLALFDDGLAAQLRRVTFVGDYQLDRVVRFTTPLRSAPSLLQPTLASLRHLALAYCSAFSLPGPLLQIEILEISVLTVEESPRTHPLENLLLNFPNLLTLEIRTTIDTSTAQIQPLTILGITSNHSDPPVVSLARLNRLVLESLPLTSSLFSSLTAPNLRILELKELTLGFDPRDVRYEMSLAGHGVGSERSSSHGLLPLPLGTFLWKMVESGTVKELTLGGIPDTVVRMCVDFVRAVGGTTEGQTGVTNLHLLEFEWKDWEPLIEAASSTSHSSATATDAPSNISLPHLHTISVFLDHASMWTSKGTVTFDHEAKFDRQGWMDGLMRFAERRMNVQAVMKMFRESKMQVAEWMKAGQRGDTDEGKGLGKVSYDPLRTVMHVELDAGYKDAYAFVHGAWRAMEKECPMQESDGAGESGNKE